MAAKHRVNQGGRALDFSCQNAQFQTNTTKGESHGTYADTRGSVFDRPLADHDGYTLWLEHAISRRDGTELYWLMWYDSEGAPTIPLSGVMGKDEVAKMSALLASFIP